MIVITLNNLKNLNASLQVGDAVYARTTTTQLGANDAEAGIPSILLGSIDATIPTGAPNLIGILRKIDNLGDGQYHLHIEEELGYSFSAGDFIMFSKFSHGDSGVLGYYAKAKFVNNSVRKAELFAISSEVIINSK